MAKNTKQQIQITAIQLFKEKGVENVTIDEICLIAGIAKSTFYYHFASKDQLLYDFFNGTRTFTPKAMSILATSNNNWSKLWACLEPTVDWSISAGSTLLSQVIILNIEKKIDSLSISEDPELAKMYIGIIAKGQEDGDFENRSDPKLIYRNLKNVSLGIATQWCITNGGFDHKAVIKESIASLLSVRKDLM